ncbi:hypothetical protein MEO93_30100 [Dolichospermum sp. ST_sed3]|nr:hypothetical protein [Dolichospermum sp. ST_sed3]
MTEIYAVIHTYHEAYSDHGKCNEITLHSTLELAKARAKKLLESTIYVKVDVEITLMFVDNTNSVIST